MRQEIQINNYKDNFQTETTMRIITKIYQNTIIITIINIYIFRVHLGSAFRRRVRVSVFVFFFFLAEKFDFSTNFYPHVCPVHCLQTHKFHFSAIFSLKMSHTVLFTHLKIILLQCFSVFSFQLYPNGPYLDKFYNLKSKNT